MKLKGRADQFTLKTLLILMISGVAVLVPLRCYQMFAVVESGSGFWAKHNFTIPLFYVILAAVIVLSVAMSFMSAKIPKTYSKKPDPLIGAGALILALSMIVDAATQFWNFFNVFLNWEELAPSDYGQLNFLLKSSSFALPIQAVFAVLSALYFMMLGFYYLNGMRSLDEFKVLAVTPVFWLLMQLVYRFARTINFINVSELLLELFLIAVMMLFFLNFSRVISEVGGKDGIRHVFAFGIPAAVLGFVCSVPRLLLVITGNGAKLTDNSPFTLWYLAASLFIVFCFIKMFNDVPEACEQAEENAPEETQSIPQEEAVVVENSAPAEDVKTEEKPSSPKVSAPVVEKFSMEALEGNTPVKSEKKAEEKPSSPKVAAPAVEKFSMEALEGNTPVKSEKKAEEKIASPKVAAPAVEKFSMEALEGNTPVKSEKKAEEKIASPKVAAPVVEKFSMEALENDAPVKNDADGERFSLDDFIKSDAYEKEEKKEVEIEHFDLESFLVKLNEEEKFDK